MIAKNFRAVIDGTFTATGLDDAFRRIALHFAALAAHGIDALPTDESGFTGSVQVSPRGDAEPSYELEPILPETIDAEVMREPKRDRNGPTTSPRVMTGTVFAEPQLIALGLQGWLEPGEYDVTGELDGETVVLRLGRPDAAELPPVTSK